MMFGERNMEIKYFLQYERPEERPQVVLKKKAEEEIGLREYGS